MEPEMVQGSGKTEAPWQTTEEQTFLIVRLGEGLYGIAATAVAYLTTVLEPVRVPAVPTVFKGIVHLRGQLITIVDLAAMLGCATDHLEKAKTTEEQLLNQRLVVLNLADKSVGFVTESVLGLREISKTAIQTEDSNLATSPTTTTTLTGKHFEQPEGVVVVLRLTELLAELVKLGY